MATLSRATRVAQINPSLSLEGPEDLGQILSPSVLNPGTRTFTSSSTPPGTQYLAEEVTLSSSGTQTHTITLDAWTDTEGLSATSTGLKVQVFRAQTDADNTGDFTIEGAAADPYELFGSGKGIDIGPGCDTGPMYFNDTLADVGPTSGGGATDILLTGTGGDTITIEMILG